MTRITGLDSGNFIMKTDSWSNRGIIVKANLMATGNGIIRMETFYGKKLTLMA